jgi:hypothetical protein
MSPRHTTDAKLLWCNGVWEPSSVDHHTSAGASRKSLIATIRHARMLAVASYSQSPAGGGVGVGAGGGGGRTRSSAPCRFKWSSRVTSRSCGSVGAMSFFGARTIAMS